MSDPDGHPTQYALKPRLAALTDALCAGLVEREVAIKLGLLAALAAEHMLLVGLPGTAKSELARRLHRAFRDATYFERLLTRFTVPEELFGPLSIAALEQDRYERHTAGFLPTASIAFIDEVFKANSAILNALLTLLNEREFDNGARRVAAPLISVVGATNEVPEDEVVAAFYDRFLVRLRLEPVSAEGFGALLRLPEQDGFGIPAGLELTRDDLAYLAASLDRVELPGEISEMLAGLRAHLDEKGIYVSDRRWRKIVRLLKTSALTDGRDAVSVWDLWLVQFCAAQRPEEQQVVEQWYEQWLGTHRALDPQRFTRVVEAFEAQLELERNANDLNYDEAGRLAFDDAVSDGKGGAHAPRMTYMRSRRYGRAHIAARVAQVQDALDSADDYLAALDTRLAELEREAAQHLWLAREFPRRAAANLRQTRANVEALRARAHSAREGFASLPALAGDPGVAPAPIAL